MATGRESGWFSGPKVRTCQRTTPKLSKRCFLDQQKLGHLTDPRKNKTPVGLNGGKFRPSAGARSAGAAGAEGSGSKRAGGAAGRDGKWMSVVILSSGSRFLLFQCILQNVGIAMSRTQGAFNCPPGTTRTFAKGRWGWWWWRMEPDGTGWEKGGNFKIEV